MKKSEFKKREMMSIIEMEGLLEVEEKDKIDCPFGNCYDECSKGLDYETCEELYEKWLLQQICDKG